MFTDIVELRTFVGIVKAGSLSAASRELGIALSVVSKRLANLERRTQVQLIVRNTRHQSLTSEGQHVLTRVQRILAEVDDAEHALLADRSEPNGVLRLSAPIVLGRAHVGPVCREIIRDHPKLSVELELTDRTVDVIDEGMDVVVRIGMPKEQDVVMRKLSDNQQILVASPEYLRKRGTPVGPKDLEGHDCLLCHWRKATWRLVQQDGVLADVNITSRLHCDNGEVVRDWAIAGCGIAMKSLVDARQDLEDGRLLRVLPGWSGEPAPICALLPQNKRIPPRVRLFLDAFADRMAAT